MLDRGGKSVGTKKDYHLFSAIEAILNQNHIICVHKFIQN